MPDFLFLGTVRVLPSFPPASVRLLVALCRERNLESQNLISTIVPVDAILHLLRSYDESE